MTNPLTVAVDFDGTLCLHEFPEIGPEIGDCIKILQRWQTLGVEVVLWTCRAGYELQDALEWAKRRSLVFDAVNSNTFSTPRYGMPKIVADLFIDDREAGWRIKGNKDLTPGRWKELDKGVRKMAMERKEKAAKEAQDAIEKGLASDDDFSVNEVPFRLSDGGE